MGNIEFIRISSRRAISLPFLLVGELLSKRSGADGLAPNVPILGLLPSSTNTEVLELDIFMHCSHQVVLGRPAGLLQSARGRSAAA